jgi:integral membrane sensor domain MASE1
MWGLERYPSAYDAARLLAIGSVYFVLARCSLTLASLHPSASPVWPPSGIALAALLIWGAGVWPAITTGAFCANALTFGSFASSVGIAAGNTLEAVVGWWLLTRWSGGTATFGTPLGVARFATVAIAPGSMISALIGVGSLVTSGYAEPAKFTGISVTWWLGDVGGLVLVTPVLVLWAVKRLAMLTPDRRPILTPRSHEVVDG